ncbi:MAG: hypothetical protein JJE17_02130 [Peptostreptococcaceae bacterium]|nr:hypothetical protein [Peptostreptococcaceae bacterium]
MSKKKLVNINVTITHDSNWSSESTFHLGISRFSHIIIINSRYVEAIVLLHLKSS